jgi:peptidoglycan hydrolase CwlO-like protein
MFDREAEAICERLGAIEATLSDLLRAVNNNQEKIVTGLTDLTNDVATLQASIAALQTEQATLITDIQTALENSDSDAAVEQIAQIVATAAQNVASLTAAQQAADPETPTAPPAPDPNPAPSGS